MRQMSSSLEMMVARAAHDARYRDTLPVDVAELERALHGALGDLQRNRPRIVEFAPRLALQRVLDLPTIHALLTGPQEQPAPLVRRRFFLAMAR